jgi:hypothetical protein
MRRTLASLFALVALGGGFGLLATMGAGCGSDTVNVENPDGSPLGGDGGVCVDVGAACQTSADCCSINCDPASHVCLAPLGGTGVCKLADEACTLATDCCNLQCTNGKCGKSLCISDNQPCTTNAECCGTVCAPAGDGGTGDVCKPLNTTCKTSGNRCGANSECCSKLCQNGVCNAAPSFCTQDGDICGSDGECCGGACNKAAGMTVGTCGVTQAPGTTGCLSAGSVCSAATTGIGDGGAVPVCGGECCSRSCRPYALTGVLVCQPPSGCHPTGELCQTDNDCCGAPGMPGSTNQNGGGQTSDVHCSKAPGATIGRCDNGRACSPAGAICRLSTNSCNATDRCCAGTVQTHPLNCKQDLLGIPRCTAESDVDCSGGPKPAGTACASSVDCCGNPCVPNPAGTPPFVCGATNCVPVSGACTTTADCCAGSPCIIPSGSTKGTCGPSGTGTTDGGGVLLTDSGTGGGSTTCAQYGQVCTANGDCCAGLSCLGGRCGVLIK